MDRYFYMIVPAQLLGGEGSDYVQFVVDRTPDSGGQPVAIAAPADHAAAVAIKNALNGGA